MPLTHSAPGTKGFSENIKREMAAGKPQKQAVAIAYRASGEKKDSVDFEALRKNLSEFLKEEQREPEHKNDRISTRNDGDILDAQIRATESEIKTLRDKIDRVARENKYDEVNRLQVLMNSAQRHLRELRARDSREDTCSKLDSALATCDSVTEKCAKKDSDQDWKVTVDGIATRYFPSKKEALEFGERKSREHGKKYWVKWDGRGPEPRHDSDSHVDLVRKRDELQSKLKSEISEVKKAMIRADLRKIEDKLHAARLDACLDRARAITDAANKKDGQPSDKESQAIWKSFERGEISRTTLITKLKKLGWSLEVIRYHLDG